SYVLLRLTQRRRQSSSAPSTWTAPAWPCWPSPWSWPGPALAAPAGAGERAGPADPVAVPPGGRSARGQPPPGRAAALAGRLAAGLAGGPQAHDPAPGGRVLLGGGRALPGRAGRPRRRAFTRQSTCWDPTPSAS
ncbi:MAG: hypothetical protein MZV63_37395, partial [Marinilabiliales bacterium]|nr:hypothetical protein [Marinilabiliales bacterium]